MMRMTRVVMILILMMAIVMNDGDNCGGDAGSGGGCENLEE